MIVTAKQLDDLKAKVEAKKAQAAKVEADLVALKAELASKAKQFMAECGIALPTQRRVTNSTASSDAQSNAKAKAIITKMIGKKRSITIKKPEKEQIAEKAGCSVKEVEATLKAEFQGLPLGKGRKSKFGLLK